MEAYADIIRFPFRHVGLQVVKQSRLGKESSCHCTRLRKASRRITQLYDMILAPSGLKITQRAVLAQIGRSEPVSVGALAHALVMDAGGLAHTLKPLVRDGLVSIEEEPQDRRNRVIKLTTLGKSKLEQSDALWEIVNRSVEKGLGRDQSKALRDAVELLISDRFIDSVKAAIASA
jgi:DNA-binding MarR family transcriptional regulator